MPLLPLPSPLSPPPPPPLPSMDRADMAIVCVNGISVCSSGDESRFLELMSTMADAVPTAWLLGLYYVRTQTGQTNTLEDPIWID